MSIRAVALVVSFAFLCVPVSGPAAAQSYKDVFRTIEEIHGDAVGFEDLFGLLTEAMRYGDPVTIASLGAYPVVVNANGETYDVLEEADLLQNWDALVSGPTMSAVAETAFEDLIVTGEGVGFGNGALWTTRICGDDACADASWAVITINE